MHTALTSITSLTTMRLPAEAHVSYARTIEDVEEFFSMLPSNANPFVLGGGSNLIIAPDIKDRPVLKMEIPGISIVEETEDVVLVQIGAGENWDDVVSWAVAHGFSGIEALSAIPGTVGATPVQNVGAYGTEIKNVFISLNAYDRETNQMVILHADDCGFGYRTSIFKSSARGRYVITDITLRLSKAMPEIPNYAGVQDYFQSCGISKPTLTEIRNAIMDIRWSKLPKPEIIPNCGSFFENPIVDSVVAEKLKIDSPDIPSWPTPDGRMKVSAGWLVEHAGMKGMHLGPVGMYEKNALVLVNTGGATYGDIVLAKNHIIEKVNELFGIRLKTEPEFVE